jgi:hypothetical protein
MTFASNDKAYGISDRSGFRYRLRDMRKEWTGALVGKDEFEPKHPQLMPRKHRADPQALRDPRPDRAEPRSTVLLISDPFITVTGDATITVLESGHGRTTGDLVRFRTVAPFSGVTAAAVMDVSGYSITVVDADTYTFECTETPASSGRGGGDFASAGPVTLEP